jgi:AraC-like DNA-binding protein/quercetin dioxygenase-like cupin family protein
VLIALKLIPSPLNPDWLIPQGWENILGANIDYRLGGSVLHLLHVQFNQHAAVADPAKPHAHPHHQILYYQRGGGWIESNGQTHSTGQGSIFFIPAGVRHHFLPAPGDAPLCLALDFSIEDAGQIALGGLPMESEVAVLLSLLHVETARPFQLSRLDHQSLDDCVAEIVSENEKREVGYATLIQSLLLRLIALCVRATQRAQGFGEHFRHTAWRYRLLTERVLELIRQQSARTPELTLPEVARTCGASANHLNRILRRQTGRTFHQLLLRERLSRARDLLARGEMNVTEAALEAGFNDSNYFARAFRKLHGYPPSQLL